MRLTYVFLNNKLIGEYKGKPPRFSKPESSYVLSDSGYWYYQSKVALIPVKPKDVPKELKALCLIMGVTIHG